MTRRNPRRAYDEQARRGRYGPALPFRLGSSAGLTVVGVMGWTAPAHGTAVSG